MILVNGKPVTPVAQASLVETEPGVYSAIVDGRSFEVRLEGGVAFAAGYRFEVQVDDPRRWKRSGDAGAAHGKASLVAPMPGKVVRVMVAAGDEVGAGQGIVVVEAMKMQNEIKSPRAGRVTSLRVRTGEGVNAGAVLATIE